LQRVRWARSTRLTALLPKQVPLFSGDAARISVEVKTELAVNLGVAMPALCDCF